jgi:DNA-binding MarR family transcriptional regulator
MDTVQHFSFRKSTAHLIRRGHQRAVAIFSDEMMSFDTTPVQFALLAALHGSPGEDQVTLAHKVALDAATSGSAIARLEARGWVRREYDKQDRRRKLLWLTDEGERAVLLMLERVPQVQARLLEKLTPEEQAQLEVLLAKLLDMPAD